jgi:hypothetical protein
MPNWCGNTLTLTHNDPEMISRAKAAFAEGKLLEEFIPIPTGLKGTTSPNREGNAEELRAQYGYTDWYDFCVNEWGTKWDVGDGQGIQTWDDNELVVYFDSAWAPPIAGYEKLLDLGFTVYATYYEPGCAFAGIFDECGDNCYNLSEMSSDEVRDELPSELDDAFGISESMAEYEAENEEELTSWYKEGVEEVGLEPHKVDPKLK